MRTLILFILFITPALAQEEETEALSAMRLGCMKSGVALGCYNYANMLVRSEKADEAEKYFERGCKLKHEGSCQKQKWDIPDRVQPVVAEEAPSHSPAPASVVEEDDNEPAFMDSSPDLINQ